MIRPEIYRKNRVFLYNSKGKPIAVQFDLRNKAMREFVEDFEDAMAAMERDDDDTRPFDEFVKEYLSESKES